MLLSSPPRLISVVFSLASIVSGLGTACTTLDIGTKAPGDPYWMETIAHQGISAFNSSPDTYQVFRNVKVGFFDLIILIYLILF